ncbi:MAG: hypothetical protein ACKVP5_23670 [Aestuariivirga sp.]
MTIDGKAALAAAGGNGKANGNAGANGKGHGKGLQSDHVQEAKTSHAKGKLSKEEAMHPGNLGRLNGFLNASPQALANASPNSAVGTLSKTYRDALLNADGTVTTDDLAGILAEAANKPLTGEQVIAVHEKLIATNPELAEDEALSAQLTDEDFADELADEANEIQATESNQGLGGDEGEEGDDIADGDDADDGDESDGALADAADAVGDAVTETASAIGDCFDETF